MSQIKCYIDNLYRTLIGDIPSDDETLIKLHTKYLEKLGDISFPLAMKNWHHLIKEASTKEFETIFNYKLGEIHTEKALEIVKNTLEKLHTKITTCKVIKCNVHLFLQRTTLFTTGITKALNERNTYGQWSLFSRNIKLVNTKADSSEDADLTTLRRALIKDVLDNLLELTTSADALNEISIKLSQNVPTDKSIATILCGPVVNANSHKDTITKASDFTTKRISDMQMLALHRYHIKFKSTSESNKLFAKLGKGSVTIELLSNKPCKSIQVSPNSLDSAHKGASFIFYNCARLETLLDEFQHKVEKGVYSSLPCVEKIDFSLLTQAEEWELLYVYILQYPYVIKNCVRSIEKGIVNPHQLVLFLSNLAAAFSVYYSRIRILTDPREHMFSIIHARIYLLKALQIVFHNSLRILNIEPIKAM